MTTRYYSSTAAETVLSATINSSATSITVVSTTGFPTLTPYTLALDFESATEELVEVTAAGGLTLTIVRAIDGTSATAHNAGARVRHVSSARDFADSRTHENSSSGVHGTTGSIVDTLSVQSMSNKTLISPAIASGSLSGTFTGNVTTTGNFVESGLHTHIAPVSDTLTNLIKVTNNAQSSDRVLIQSDGHSEIRMSNPARTAFDVYAASGQTADIVRFKDSAGVDRYELLADGRSRTTGSIDSSSSSFPAVTLRDTGGASNLLLDGKNSSGTTVASITMDGTISNGIGDKSVLDAATGAFTTYSANTFGTYVPTVGGGGSVTWTTRTGWFMKIGKMVFFNAYLVVNTAGSGGAFVSVDAPSSIERTDRQVVTMGGEALAAGFTSGHAVSFTGGTGATFDRLRGSTTNIVGSDLVSGAIITLQGWYREA